jgi:hypothetical protein
MESHLNKIRRLESSGGRNDSCLKSDLINGYGYAQSTFSNMCYKSHTEVRNLVRKWFEKRIPEMGIATAVCYYNTGHKTDDCKYYKAYLTINYE